MKGKKKIIVPLLLASVTATGLVADIHQQQNIQVKAETIASSDIENINGAELNVYPFAKSSYNIGDRVFMPKCEIVDGQGSVEIEYTVKKGNKVVSLSELTQEEKDADNALPEADRLYGNYEVGDKYFVANYVGYFNVSVSAKEEGRVVSTVDNLSVWVEKQEAVINLPVNSQYVIPAKVPTNQDGLKIPVPTVTIDDNGEDVEKKVTELTGNNSLSVYLNTPSEDVALTLDSTNSFYAVDKDKLSEAGTYTIVYEYKVGTSVISRLESNFQVVSDYDTSKIKLAMSFLDSMPSTGNVNTDIKIPKVKVTENASSTDSINAYVNVVVKNVKTGDTLNVNYNDYTFHPTTEGFYSVTYVASIPLFGENCKTNEITPGDIIEVKDKQAPVLIPTYAYALSDEGEITVVYNTGDDTGTQVTATTDKTVREVAEELLVNRKVDIPSVAVLKNDGDNGKSVKVKIPAAYATDNFYTYKGTEFDDIVITRSYRTSTGSVVSVQTPANEVAEIEFKTKGNSEIRYKATDKKGNTLGEIVYDIVIYDVDEDLTAGVTKIDLNVGTELVSENEKTLTFAKPTAKDTYDSNVEVRTWYELVGVTGAEPVELTETNADGKYEIEIGKLSPEATAIKIYSNAYVDKTLVNTNRENGQLVDTNEVRSQEYTVKILRNSTDETSATFAIVGDTGASWNTKLFEKNSAIAIENADSIDDAGYAKNGSNYIPVKPESELNLAAFNQGSEVLELPEVTFTDTDSNLTIQVIIKDRSGNEVSKDTQEVIERTQNGTDYVYTISGAKFKLSSYGIYTITYRAEDYAGNITAKTFGIRVNDKTAPTIAVDDEDKYGQEIEVGEYFRVPAARLVKNGETVNGTVNWEIISVSNGTKYSKQPNGFTPLSEGTFLIRYTAEDEYGNPAVLEDSMFTITAKDTTAPTLELDMTYRMPTSKAWEPEEGNDYMVIDIPVAIATDKLTKKDLEVVITVTGPNGTKPTVYDYNDRDNVKYFRATAQGTYTVTYTTVDDADNESKITREIGIGDVIKPTLSWNNKDADLPKEVQLNNKYVLDLNKMITLSDNQSSTAELLEKIRITLTAPDGTTVSNNLSDGTGYEWSFTQTGSYTLKFVVEDKVGNQQVYTETINVPSEKTEENKVSPVLGTVLVVLSVVVLAGVVVYFVASSKKKPNTKAKTKKSK